jgi:cysteinyl-tRNA synthetase
MSLKHLGEQIDIHGGGNDLVFPHHENEIAQTESRTGKPFARFWVHNGMVQLINPATKQVEKMSKSIGNVVRISDFLQQYDADVFRLIVLGSYYRSPLAYNADVAADAGRRLERLLGALRPSAGADTTGPATEALAAAATLARESFQATMDNDFNTAGSLAALFELVRAINIARDTSVGGLPFVQAQNALRELAGVLGLRLAPKVVAGQQAAPFIELLIATRAALRKAKQYQLADDVRKSLAELGVTLEDGPQGTTWKMG